MKTLSKGINKLCTFFLSKERKVLFERIIILAAILTFVIHLLFVLLIYAGLIPPHLYNGNGFVPNPIATIYTPFTIVLLYEVYLLIYYLPRSITGYIGKQYEIVALILVRKIFDGLANLFSKTGDLDFAGIKNLLLIFIGFIVLLLLIYCFYELNGIRHTNREDFICRDKKQERFVLIKKILAIGLLMLFFFLFVRSLFEFHGIKDFTIDGFNVLIKRINDAFFGTFFTALVLTEVLLLLFMYDLSDNFSKVIRNSGFIISTILLKLSFRAEGMMNIIMILIAVAFGVAILGMYKLLRSKPG